jgi:hypothetical protein
MIARVIVAVMDVYLVPGGPHGLALYCESATDPAPPRPDGTSGRMKWLHDFWTWLHDQFTAVLAAIEREHDRLPSAPAAPVESGGLVQRLRAHGLRWIAERVAEQRLLWRLRGQTAVRAFFPAGIDPAAAHATIRVSLERDARRHVLWLAVDTLGGLCSLLLVPFPGPNVPGYYFSFRIVGHLLAIRGARQGLRVVSWELQPSALLAELGQLEQLPEAERTRRVRAVAQELGLPRLARFFERTAVEAA